MLTTEVHPVPPLGPTGQRGRSALSRSEWEQANRLGLLLLHGLVGLFAGVLILFNGTSQTFDRLGSWPRPVTGSLAFAGGALLLTGLARNRSLPLEAAGLSVLALWDLVMTTAFVVTAMSVDHVVAAWPWQALPHVEPVRLYPIVLYVGLFLMMCVHLVTLAQIRSTDRRRRVVRGVLRVS